MQYAFCNEKDGIFCLLWNKACEAYNSSQTPTSLGSGAPLSGGFPAAKSTGGTTMFGTGAVGFGATGGFGTSGFGATKTANPASELWPYYKLWFEYHEKKRIKEDLKVKNDLVLRDRNEIEQRERSRTPRFPRGRAALATRECSTQFICGMPVDFILVLFIFIFQVVSSLIASSSLRTTLKAHGPSSSAKCKLYSVTRCF